MLVASESDDENKDVKLSFCIQTFHLFRTIGHIKMNYDEFLKPYSLCYNTTHNINR